MLTPLRKSSIVAAVIALATLFVIANRLTAQPAPTVQDLATMSLQSDDFSEEVIVFADEPISAEEITHPLGSGPLAQELAAENKTLLNYDDAYGFGAAVTSASGTVGHFQYQYPTEEIAKQIASLVFQRLSKAPGATILQEKSTIGAASGHTVKLIGDEGDFVYWFVGNRANVVSMIVVNGLEENKVAKAFESILPIALNK